MRDLSNILQSLHNALANSVTTGVGELRIEERCILRIEDS